MAERNINITIANKKATVIGAPVIVCGNSDYTATFTFDDEWNLTGPRTARFVYVKDGKVQHQDVVFSGNVVAVPILENVDFVDVGVYAGNLCTTTPARVRCKKSILCGSGVHHDPTPDIYDQIMELFNEMAEAGAFGATEAQAQQIEKNKQDIAQLSGYVEAFMLEEYATPEMFGAAGDGKTDDTQAILYCLNSPCNRVVFSSGTYLFNGDVSSIKNKIIIGNGATIKGKMHFKKCEDIIIKGLTFDGSQIWYIRPYATESTYEKYYTDRQNSDSAIIINSCRNVHIYDCVSQYALQGFPIVSSENVLIDNCHTYYTMADGFFVCDNSSFVSVKNSTVHNANDDCFATFGNDNEKGTPHNVYFENCYAENSHGALICLMGTKNSYAVNCSGFELKNFPLKMGNGHNGTAQQTNGENQVVINCFVDYGGIEVLDGSPNNNGTNTTGFVVGGTKLYIDNMKINFKPTSGHNINIKGATDLIIKNCQISGFSFFDMSKLTDFVLENNYIRGLSRYVNVSEVNGLQFRENKFESSGSRTIYLKATTNAILRDNDYGESTDFDISLGSGDVVSDNIKFDTQRLANCKSSYITNARIEGVAVIDTAQNHIAKNALAANQLYMQDGVLGVIGIN